MSAKEYISRIHLLPCVICKFKLGENFTPAIEAHHVIPGDDWSVVSLCRSHHQEPPFGLHYLHRRAFNNYWKVDELWLISRTAELLAKQ